MTFNGCREGSEQLDGPISFYGNYSPTGNDSFTMKLDDGNGDLIGTVFSVSLFTDSTSQTPFATYKADMTMSGSGDVDLNDPTGNTFRFTFTANGKEEYTEGSNTFSMTFSSLQFTASQTYSDNGTPTNYTDDTTTGTDTLNGGFSESWTDAGTNKGISITFTSFVFSWTETASYVEWSVDGTVSLDFTPNDLCFEGTFVIDTTTPVHKDLTTGKTTQGRIVINTNTVIVFNADGSVTVTVDGQSANYNSEDDLENTSCPIADFE